MPLVVVDIEADGPAPGLHSMVCFGAVLVEPSLSKTFYGQCRPLPDARPYIPEALAVSGFSRKSHERFSDPVETMADFADWVSTIKGRPVFVSDNLAFDWQFINYYFHRFCDKNPFGWSGRRIGDLYAGYKNDFFVQWKHLRKTRHTHDPVDDARGNAEALLAMREMGLKVPIK